MRTFGHKMPLQNGSSPKFCPSLLLIYYTTASNSFGPTQLPLPRLHQEATFQFVHREMVWWWRHHPLTSSVGVVKAQLGCHAWISVKSCKMIAHLHHGAPQSAATSCSFAISNLSISVSMLLLLLQ